MDKTLVITTTIKPLPNIDSLFLVDNFENVDFLIIGDKLTQEEEYRLISSDERILNNYWSYEDQKSWLKRYTNYNANFFRSLIPERSIQRRNMGILYAIKNNYDYLISIDDDNFPMKDWLTKFNLEDVGIFLSNSGQNWFDYSLYYTGSVSRGFPLYTQLSDLYNVNRFSEPLNVVVRQGIIRGDTDRTALDRYIYPDKSYSLVRSLDNIVLDINVWAPFNTQNTKFKRDIFDILYLFPMNSEVGRYDDILMSYIVNKICHHLEWHVSFGEPVVMQDRNKHNLYLDLKQELNGAVIGNILLEYLYEIKLTGETPLECYREIAQLILDRCRRSDLYSIYLRSIGINMLMWSRLVEDLKND